MALIDGMDDYTGSGINASSQSQKVEVKMDFAKLFAYLGSIASSVLGILVVTHNVGDAQAQQIGVVVSGLLNAVAVIFAANTQSSKVVKTQ